MGTGYKVVMPSLRPRKESGLVGAWDLGDPVNGVVYDLSGNGNNMAVGAPACVEQGPIGKGMNFHGISRGTVADAATLDFGTGEFSLEGWFNLPAILDDASGDLASKYDATIRRGFNLGLLCNEGNHNNLFFGMDNNQADGTWTQAAAQLGGQTHIYSLAVWNGALYGGTYPNGLLYRYDVGVGWVQVAAQLGAQTGIYSLAVWNGALYGGTGNNGLLYRYDVGVGWVQVAAQLGAQIEIFSLAVWNGALYGGTDPNGLLYRYDVGVGWVQVAAQLGAQTRIRALAVWNGALYGGTYNLGRLYRYDVGVGWVQVAAQLGAQTEIFSLAVWNGALYGGTYNLGRLYRYDVGVGWVQVAAQLGAQAYIFSLAVWNGALYGGTYPNGLLYRYDVGVGWVQVAAQLGAQTGIRALAVWNGALYGGTDPNGLLYRWQTGRAAQGDTELQAGRHHFAAVRDNTSLTLKLYVDGALLDESEAFVAANYDLDTATPLYIGFGEEDYFKSVIHITEVYKGVARTAGQIRNDYLKARTAGWKTTYDVAVSSADEGGVIADQLGRASSSPAPIFFADTTGRWKIETATVGGATNTKVVANRTTVGTLYIPTAYYNQNTTEAAFGTPEAWFYIPAASICYWMLEASVAGAWNAAGQNGYRVTFDGTTGTISLHRITAGAVAATLYVSGAGVFTAASWFKYTRPRTTAGVFTGKVNDATHNATGGGANPSAADVTYTTSTYQIWQTTTAVGAMVALADKSGGHCMWKGVI